MNLFDWRNAIILIARDAYSISLSHDIINYGNKNNIDFVQIIYDKTDNPSDIADRIKETNLKIIVFIGSDEFFPSPFQSLNAKDNYVWIFSEYIGEELYRQGLNEWLTENALITRPLSRTTKMEKLNLIKEKIAEYEDICKNSMYEWAYLLFTIDSVDSMLQAYENCLNDLDETSCSNRETYFEYLNELQMEGLIGNVDFHNNKTIEVYELHKADMKRTIPVSSLTPGECNKTNFCEHFTNSQEDCMKYSREHYDIETNSCTLVNFASWPGKDKKVPADGIVPSFIDMNHSVTIISFVISFSLLILFTITLSIVLKYGETDVIIKSGKLFLVSILVGLILMVLSYLFYIGLPNGWTCNLRIWTFYLSYSFVLAPLIIKGRILQVASINRTEPKSFIISKDIIILYSIIIGPVIGLLILWSSIIQPQRDIIEGHFTCTLSTPFSIVGFIYFTLLIITNVVIIMTTKKIDDVYKETEYLKTMSILIFFQGCIYIIFNLMIIDLVGIAIVQIVLLSLLAVSIWAILFIPKLYSYVYKKD